MALCVLYKMSLLKVKEIKQLNNRVCHAVFGWMVVWWMDGWV